MDLSRKIVWTRQAERIGIPKHPNREILTRMSGKDPEMPEEVRQAVRMSGKGSMNEVRAVVLETDGTMSVINTSDEGDDSDILPEA